MAAAAAHKICLVGSGNWGSAIARIAGFNAPLLDGFDSTVNMWVFEEEVEGGKLSEIINERHENVKYLPGVKLPENVLAIPDLAEAVTGCDILIFVLPHQFLPRLLPTIRPVLRKDAIAISLIKGLDFDDREGPVLISDTIRAGLEIPVAVLMGANVASEVAADEFCEATIGSKDAAVGALLSQVFMRPTFRVSVVSDPVTVEMCGALKNVVALGAGFCDGLALGGNTKAAIIRMGMKEMMKFIALFNPDMEAMTLLESCGVADLITTCFGGRNRKCAAEFVRSGRSWEEVEVALLNGQKLQGTLTSAEVQKAIMRRDMAADFPLFSAIHAVAFEGLPAADLFSRLS
eukprot:PLAT6500.2.p1 GENE.PLAT6500.2~~PLAT6500.2.p1  ORF type:complete len:347 (-),score=146.64 PLAT6500.2:155-1195(-)